MTSLDFKPQLTSMLASMIFIVLSTKNSLFLKAMIDRTSLGPAPVTDK